MDPDLRREAYYESRFLARAKDDPSFDPDVSRLLISLIQAHDRLERQFSTALAQVDLTLASFNVLAILQDRGEVPLKELGSLLLKTPANITGLIDGLARRGLVERRPHSQDRRIKLAVLLPPGKELIDEIFPRYHRFCKCMMGGLEQAERIQLTSLLKRLAHSVCEADEAQL